MERYAYVSSISLAGCLLFSKPITNYHPFFSENVFKEKYGVWDPMPDLTITQLCSQLYSPPLQRERGGVGKISPIG